MSHLSSKQGQLQKHLLFSVSNILLAQLYQNVSQGTRGMTPSDSAGNVIGIMFWRKVGEGGGRGGEREIGINFFNRTSKPTMCCHSFVCFIRKRRSAVEGTTV